MTAQESRAMFEARMKQSPAYKPELMKWTDGRYDFDIMESAYQGFMLGLEAAQAQRAPLTDGEILSEQEKLIAARKVLYKSRIGLPCSRCKTGKYRADSNGYNDFHRCDSCIHVPMWGGDGKEWGTQEKQG